MVYSLEKFSHYLLGATFKFFADHTMPKYLVNKPLLEGRIYRWLLLFQEFTFEVVIKPNRLNVGPDHLSQLEIAENEGAMDDQLLDSDLFKIEAISDHLEEITTLLRTCQCREGYIVAQR